MSISGKISIILILILIISGVIYFKFMNNKPTIEPVESGNSATEVKGDVVLKTNFGDIVIDLFNKQAPKTTGNFEKLAKEGFYDGVKFHRVIKDFMIQGGDPLSKDDTNSVAWGTGGPGYSFEDEFYTGNSNAIGTISMANAGPNTNGSQFFINTADNNFLDQKHVVFGKVVSGMDVVNEIQNSPVGSRDIPVSPVIIESITLLN